MSTSRLLALPLVSILAAGCSSDAPKVEAGSGPAAAAGEGAGQGQATPDPGAAEPSKAEPAGPDAASPPEPAIPEPPPPPPSFAEQVATLVDGAAPSEESGKIAWTHYEAKEYREAQVHFALAALHDTSSWKPAFNLACASAQAGDEAMVQIALAEAVARDPETVPGKARADKDLAAYRSAAWFEGALKPKPEPDLDNADTDDDDDDFEQGTMFFVLEWGPDGPGGVAYLDDMEMFGIYSRDGRRIEVAPDGMDYVLRTSGTPSIAANYPSAKRVPIDAGLGSVWNFDARAGGELWALGYKGLGHYSPQTQTWKVYPTADTVAANDGYPIGIEVADDGKVWVANQHAVFALAGDRFESAALPGAASKQVELLRGADGQLYLHREADVLQLAGASWVATPGPKPPAGGILDEVTVLADGSIVAFTQPDHRLVRVTKDGTSSHLTLDAETEADALGVDTSGRIWAGTPGGVYVIAPNFIKISHRYGVGSIDAFAAKDGRECIRQFVSLGPPIPLPPSEAPRGIVVGRLIYAGEPLADRRFEICPDPARNDREMGSMGTPCEFNDDRNGGKTDAEGRFRMTGVTGAAYDFAAFVPGGKIGATDDYPCCPDMPDEGVYDLGDVVLR